jgi:hypothetical protein
VQRRSPLIDEQPKSVGTGLSRDISPAEKVEAEIDTMISRRHDRRVSEEGHRPSEEMYEEGVRRYRERMLAAALAEWHAHHVGQADSWRRTLEALIAHHTQQAEKCLLPKGNQE